MLWIMVCVATGIVGGKLADIEDRSTYLWGAGTAGLAYLASGWLGDWFGLAPLLALAVCFAGLWILKSRDDSRRGGGGKVVR